MRKLLYTIADNDLYYVLSLALLLICAFDVGLIIGWIWSST